MSTSPGAPNPIPPAATTTATTAPAAQNAFAVLYVDDEEQALKYFAKAFGKHFPVLTANCVDNALALLMTEHARVGVVMSDHRMPGKTGIELLSAVREKWPQISRIIVTAYADMESAIASVNSGAVYKYLTKPIDLAQTKQVLIEAMKTFTDLRERESSPSIAEQGDMIGRMILADRVESMSRLATGVSHHVRNSLTAMSAFFDELNEKVATAKAGQPGPLGENDAYLDELMQLANAERQRLVGMVDAVEASGERPKFTYADQLDLAELTARATAAVAGKLTAGTTVQADVKPGLATLKLNAAAVTRLLATLIARASRYAPKGSAVRVSAEGPFKYWNTTGVKVRVLVDGPAWPEADVASFFTPFSLVCQDPGDLGTELLDAFQAAVGHAGDIVVHRTPPTGPGFELTLPLDPAMVQRAKLIDGQLQMPPAA